MRPQRTHAPARNPPEAEALGLKEGGGGGMGSGGEEAIGMERGCTITSNRKSAKRRRRRKRNLSSMGITYAFPMLRV